MKRFLLIFLLLPAFGFSQVSSFMGRYDVSKVDSVNDSIWKLTGTFVDVTGSWTALDADTGDKIIQRGYNSTGKVVFDRYVVTGISSATAVNLDVFVKSDFAAGVQNMTGMPFTGSFPIATPTSDTSTLTYRASFYQNSIDPDYDAALDNLNIREVNSTNNDYGDTLASHNERINQRVRSVTATSPVVSSGGYTPNISLDTAKVVLFNDTLPAGNIATKDMLLDSAAAKVYGTGTTNYIPKWTNSKKLGDSPIYTDGTNVGVGTTSITDGVLKVSGLGNTGDSGNGLLTLITTNSGTTGVGPNIHFIGSDGSIPNRSWGGLGVRKENSTAGNTASYMDFFTRPAGGGLTERMRITSTGNVGIGTTSPGSILELRGGSPQLTVDDTQSNGAMYVSMKDNGTQKSFFGLINIDSWGGISGSLDGDMFVTTHATNNPNGRIVLATGQNVTKGIIINSSGNVGIGTTAPTTKLDVQGTGRFSGSLALRTLQSLTATDTVLGTKGTVGYFAPNTFAPYSHTQAWTTITGVPGTYTPTTHAHSQYRELTNHDSLSTLDEKSYNSLTDKPTSWGISAITNLQDSLNDRYRRKDTATVLLGRTRAASTYVPKTLTVSTTTPLSGGGDLSTNRTFAIIADTLTAWRTKQNQWKNDSANYAKKTYVVNRDTLVQQYARTRDALKVSKADSNINGSYTSKKYVDGKTWGISTITGLSDSLNDRYRRKDTATVLLSRTRASHDYQVKGSYRTMTNHDSLSTLDEKSYNSLTDKPTSWAISAITGLQDSLTKAIMWPDTITKITTAYDLATHTQPISRVTLLSDTLLRLHDTIDNYTHKTRKVNTTSPLSGGGNLSADRTIAIISDTLSAWYAKMNQWKNDSANYAKKTYVHRPKRPL